MDLLTAEKAIRERLKSQLNTSTTSDFKVPYIDTFPQDPVNHWESLHPNGEILVRFERLIGPVPEPNRSKEIVQDIVIEWTVWVVARELVKPDGVYSYIEKVKDALSGWTLSITEGSTTTTWNDSSMFYLTDAELIDEQNGIWFYALTFQHILEEK